MHNFLLSEYDHLFHDFLVVSMLHFFGLQISIFFFFTFLGLETIKNVSRFINLYDF